MSRFDRRTFLCGLTVSVVGSRAAAGATTPSAPAERDAGAAVAWHRAPCRLCGVGCGLLVALEGRRVTAVRGDPESPVGQGLACAKGYFSVQALSGADRIRRATIRRGDQRVDVSMREALDTVARRIREAVSSHGPSSVALYGSAQASVTDAYIGARLFKGFIGSNRVESSSRLYAAAGMAGEETSFGRAGALARFADIDTADVIVLWDIDLAETDPVLFSRVLARRRADRAVRLVELASRRTRSSHGLDASIAHEPLAAPLLANAIAHELAAQGKVDRRFLARHVSFRREDGSPADWEDYVAYLEAFTPDRVAARTGVDPDRLRWLATLYGDGARNVLSIWGANVNRHARGTLTNNLLHNLHLLAGKVARSGNGALVLSGQPGGGDPVQDAGMLTERLPRGRVEQAADRERAAAIWGVAAGQLSAEPGPPLLELIAAFERGEVRVLWVQGTNPVLSLPAGERLRRAAARGDRTLVVSEAYPTLTSDAATIVLPTAMWLERAGVLANAERRLQFSPALVAPPGEAMSDGWQMIEVARRLGHHAAFAWTRDEYVARAWEELGRFHADSDSPLPPLDALRRGSGLCWPYVEGREVTRRHRGGQDPAADPARGDVDFHAFPDGRARIWLRDVGTATEAPDAAYPLWLTTGPVLEHWGGGAMTRRIPTLHRALPAAYVELHREDARRLGLANGDRARLVSRRGALTATVRLDFRSQPPRGQCFVPSFDESVPVASLMPIASCPLSGQPDAVACAVRVERAPLEESP